MSTDFLNGRRFVFVKEIEIPQTENTNDLMDGHVISEDGEVTPVTLTRDDIEKGRALFLMTREEYDDLHDYGYDVGVDTDAMEQEIFGDTESDVWLVPIEGSDPIGHRYSIDRDNRVLTYETDEGLKTVQGNDYTNALLNAVRVDETGRMICQFAIALEVQEKLCEEAGATEHLAEIEKDFDLMKRNPDGYVQGRAYTRDIKKITPDETYTDDMIFAKIRERQETLVEKSDLQGRTETDWDILLNNSMFRNPQVRSIFNYFMGTRLKDFPIDQVGIAQFSTLDEAISVLADAFPEQKEVAPFEGGSIMPGYRTSTVHEFTDGKMTVITFSDLPGMTANAYAYPNELTLDADVKPDSPAPAY
jgi:hypothetical protein